MMELIERRAWIRQEPLPGVDDLLKAAGVHLRDDLDDPWPGIHN